MRILDLIAEDHIITSLNGKTKEEVIEEMVELLDKRGKLNDRELYKKEVLKRERASSTGLEEGIAIPHAKSSAVKKNAIVFGRSETGVEYDSLDGEPSKLFFMIAATEGANDAHIEALSKLTTGLLEEEYREGLLKASNSTEVMEVIAQMDKEKKHEISAIDTGKYVVGITACPVGIAHTYMAADALNKAAREMGVKIKVETNGSVGTKNTLTSKDIEDAMGVIVAADKKVDMERFNGKPLIQTSVKAAISKPKELIEKSMEAPIYKSKESGNAVAKDNGNEGIYKHLMNGVSHMLPLVVCGGVLIALSIALSGVKAGEGAAVTNPFFKQMLDLGVEAFGLMVPILAGYIAVSIADRPGLAPGLVGGALANKLGAGFLGGIIAGFAAGYIARWVKSWKVPETLQAIMPIFVIPLVSTCLVGLIMGIIGVPISGIMENMTSALQNMEQGSIGLALILGLMIAFDMGGPVNKVAFLFGASMISQGVSTVMGPIAVAICVPPIGMGIATLMAPKKFEAGEREAGKAALAMGCIGITEGAIPFAAADPLRVIPANMIGAGIGAVIAAMGNVADHAPHGGLIVLPVVDNKILFVVAIIVGSLVTATITSVLKTKKQEITI
jgi:PTS system fructose-specific IIC component